jgi:hypothetical protein
MYEDGGSDKIISDLFYTSYVIHVNESIYEKDIQIDIVNCC